MTKYYLIKTEYPITTYKDDEVVDDITPDMIGKNFVELTEKEILIITNIGDIKGPSKEVEAYCEARKKIRKVLE